MIRVQELEALIRELIVDIYEKEYIGKLNIKPLNPGYCIEFGLDHPECPYVLCAQLEDEAFIKFIKKELKNIRWFHQDYGGLKKLYPVEKCPPAKQCCKIK